MHHQSSTSNDYIEISYVLTVAFFVFLFVFFVNEYTVYTEKNKFRDYRQNTVEYDITKPQAIKGRYCFVCGPITVMDPVCDAEFGVFTDQPYLERKVETYQWQEIS